MITTINNNSRIFLIHRKGYFPRSYFCNIEQIEEVLTKELEPNDEYTISEYWNFKFKRVSKKHINEMFKANSINFQIR